MIDGANHFSFSDQMFTKSAVMIEALQTVGVIGPLDKRRGIGIAEACVQTFFDVRLKDAPASDLISLLLLSRSTPGPQKGISKDGIATVNALVATGYFPP
jgi:hypothetical protein